MDEQVTEQPTEAPAEAAPAEQPAEQPKKPGGAGSPVQRVLVAAMRVVHEPKVAQQLLAILKAGGKNPAGALAQAAVTVIAALFQKAEGKIPPQVLQDPQFAKGIVLMVAELASSANVLQVTQQVLAQAVQMVSKNLEAALQKAMAGGEQAAPEQAPAEAAPQEQPQPGLIGMGG